MEIYENIKKAFEYPGLYTDAVEYTLDASQRAVLYLDVMRKRGNQYFDHREMGMPPVLTFDYEVLVDGRSFDRPVNFSLVRILDRRHVKEVPKEAEADKRQNPVEKSPFDPKKRPIIIIDPRAGHGPGIGGSKRDSEIGMALNEGHPVYFIVFSAQPVPGQNMLDVHDAQIRFIEEVIKRHPEAENPAIIGNCQAGWAAALIAADRPEIVGPLVLNGSPLSYWAGVDGKHPMRYRGGLAGGTWVTSFWSDMGRGIFDGAHLVNNFETLNPANTLWGKQYYLWAHVDKEEKRYLDFERWWNGFFMLTRDEIHYIIENLFVGNKLEQGMLEMRGRKIDLNRLKEPILVFASSGDNITPPSQALNWIVNVWGSEEEIKRQNKVIVYLLHDTIGHLGIFVSSKVSQKEHKEIIASIDLIGFLSPGLYEMVIDQGPDGKYDVRFEERKMLDILALDDGVLDEADFKHVKAMSELSDRMYRMFLSPWIRAFVTDDMADTIRQLHPLRTSTYSFSDINPWMLPVKMLAPIVKENRQQAGSRNLFVQMERNFAQVTTDVLNLYRDVRDQFQEFMFKSLFGNIMMPDPNWFDPIHEEAEMVCEADLVDALENGGFTEGVLRIMVAASLSDQGLRRQALRKYAQIAAKEKRLEKLDLPELRHKIRQQACVLQNDEESALAALSKLITKPKDRKAALAIADSIVHPENGNGNGVNESQKAVLEKIHDVLSK